MKQQSLKTGVIAIFGVFLLIIVMNGCSTGEEPATENPVPVLTSVSPGIRALNMPAITMTVTGTGFINGSVVVFNGAVLSTQYVSSTQLYATLDTATVSIASTATHNNPSTVSNETGTAPVLVRNPAPGGGDSNSYNFTLTTHPTFTTPYQLEGDLVSSFNPAIALDSDGNICVVYESYDDETVTYSISYTRSPDGGTTWSTPIHLAEYDERIYNPCIAIGPDNAINVAFYAVRLYHLRSTDDGVTWSLPTIISDDSNVPIVPDIAVDINNGINIVWSQIVRGSSYDSFPLFFVRSIDNGATFTTPVMPFADDGGASVTFNPVLITDDSGGVYTAWAMWPSGGSRFSSGFFDYSHDYGVTWNDTDTHLGACSSSDLAVDPDGNINLIVSASYIPYMNQINWYKSEDLGITWNTGVAVTKENNENSPLMEIDSIGNIDIIFQRGSTTFFTRSIDGGNQWSDVDSIANDVYVADMAKDAWGNLYVVYEINNSGLVYFTRTEY